MRRHPPQIGALCALSTLLLVIAARAAELPDAGNDNQAGLVFTPDGRRAYWTEWNGVWGEAGTQRVISVAERVGDGWTAPEPAPFTGDYSDDDPFVSPDGQWLYFVSERPDGGEPSADIWRFSLVEPDRLERLSINSEATEYSPVITASGVLYFASTRDGGPGQSDVYRAAPTETGFEPPTTLGNSINSPTGEWNLWVSADEREMIFEASSRPANVSASGDLYFSCRNSSGWLNAIPIRHLNTSGSELLPRLRLDGKTLYYTTAPLGGHARIAIADWTLLRAALRQASATQGQHCGEE